ncbi:MAG: hypothetical protein RLZZ592_2778, partial [Pseudomonadota bacterium]
MTPKALFALCDELLHEVLRFTTPADAVVSSFFRQNRALGARERQTLAETVYEVLRRRAKYQYLARSGHGSIERRLILLAWQGSEAYLNAAITEGERTWLDNCRQFDPMKASKGHNAALVHNLPEWLVEPLKAQVGEEFDALAQALLQP